MSFSYYQIATGASAQCGSSGALASFPVVINRGSVADWATVANGGKMQSSSAYDLRPHSDLALTTALVFELVPSTYNAVTGALEMHVNAGTGASQVTSTSDWLIYFGFGDASLSSDASSTSAWASAYQAVWHFGSAASLGTADSTSHAATLTPGTNATATAGQIGGGVDFGAASNQSRATFGSINLGTVHSLEFWLYYSDAGADKIFAGIQAGGGSGMSLTGTRQPLYSPPGSAAVYSNTSISASTWTHIVWTRTGTTPLLYVNGVSTAFSGGPLTNNALALDVLGSVGALTGPACKLDEMRFTNVVQTQSYITAAYNNQKASSTLLSWGATTATGPSSAQLVPVFRLEASVQMVGLVYQ